MLGKFQKKKVVLAWLACASLASTEAFVVRSPSSMTSLSSIKSPTTTCTFMSEDDHGEPVNTDDQEVEESFITGEPEVQYDEQQQEGHEEEPIEEKDPELVALEKEIVKRRAEQQKMMADCRAELIALHVKSVVLVALYEKIARKGATLAETRVNMQADRSRKAKLDDYDYSSLVVWGAFKKEYAQKETE